ncbi:MAG: UDP-N-acetylglucosamine 2-epimerase (non-hydrolyzing) [Chitinispirillaceae bacterium]|nr:UDP-N-acetylglucosamine 2-epimerase (non-hydrolyzing) [Chitinispirillaceae bacterium]
MKKIVLVAGARPNFMKVAPILRTIERYSHELCGVLVHTGQHYDRNMSHTFFTSLGIREPDYNLEAGSGSHAAQTAHVMIRFEEVCLKENPDIVLVVGDVNSTIAAGLVAKKLHISLCHVEAGLRSRDRSMPEEINRLATDAITDIFFTTEPEGTANLLGEGHTKDTVHFVGHVMIDNLFYQLERISNDGDRLIDPSVKDLKKRLPEKYFCLTMHRPSNVDNKETLSGLLKAIAETGLKAPIVFPCHPRTRKNIDLFGLSPFLHPAERDGGDSAFITSGIVATEPLGYNDFLYLWKDAAGVLTDSGGMQEETTALKIPCITMRTTTERPITVQIGSNEVVGTRGDRVIALAHKILQGEWKTSRVPDLWDGDASKRIVEVLRR